MGICRLRRGIKRLAGRSASTLIESLVALAMIAVCATMFVMGLSYSLDLYAYGTDIRNAASAARREMEAAGLDGVIAPEYDGTPFELRMLPPYYPEQESYSGVDDYEIQVYTYIVSQNSRFPDDNMSFYYFVPTE